MVAAQQMVGLLVQIGQISEYAADIFTSKCCSSQPCLVPAFPALSCAPAHLFTFRPSPSILPPLPRADLLVEATATADRITALAERTQTLESNLPEIDNAFARTAPAVFYHNVADVTWKRAERIEHNLFSAENRPAPIEKVRSVAYAPPRVSILDDISGQSCLKLYSDPEFFLRQWFEEETKLSAARAQGKKKTKRRKPRTKAAPEELASIDIKVFSAHGKEFGGASVQTVQTGTAASAAQLAAQLRQQQLEASQRQHEEQLLRQSASSAGVGAGDFMRQSSLGLGMSPSHAGTHGQTGGIGLDAPPPPPPPPPRPPQPHLRVGARPRVWRASQSSRAPRPPSTAPTSQPTPLTTPRAAAHASAPAA